MKITKKLIKPFATLLLGVFTLGTLIGCGNKTPVAEGYLWTATKGDVTINLIGTMHPAPSTHNFFNKKVTKILKNTDVLSVEADITDMAKVTASQDKLLNTSDKTAKNQLTEDEIKKVNEILAPSNMNISALSVLTPAGIVSILESTMYQEENYTTSFDELLIKKSQEKGIEIHELESVDFQLDLLNNLYTWDDVKATIATVTDSSKKDETIKYLKDTFNAYVDGNIEFLEEDVANMKKEVPEFYDALVTQRNIKMAENIDKLVEDGKNHTIAVGCKHFIGEDSVLKELEKRGYTINRL